MRDPGQGAAEKERPIGLQERSKNEKKTKSTT